MNSRKRFRFFLGRGVHHEATLSPGATRILSLSQGHREKSFRSQTVPLPASIIAISSPSSSSSFSSSSSRTHRDSAGRPPELECQSQDPSSSIAPNATLTFGRSSHTMKYGLARYFPRSPVTSDLDDTDRRASLGLKQAGLRHFAFDPNSIRVYEKAKMGREGRTSRKPFATSLRGFKPVRFLIFSSSAPLSWSRGKRIQG